MQKTAIVRRPAEIRNRLCVPILTTMRLVARDPRSAPILPPAEIKPNLLARKNICHEAPEDGNDRQVENAEPDNESASYPDIVSLFFQQIAKHCPEDQDVGDKKKVHPGQKLAPRVTRRDPAEIGKRPGDCHVFVSFDAKNPAE